MPGKRQESRRHRGLRVFIAAALACGLLDVNAAPAPSAPATSSGSYTVSYGSCGGCSTVWLEERTSPGGSWTAVGDSPATFSNKAPGVYDYRAGLLYWGSGYDYQLEYSAIATVVVGSNLPRAQSLTQQFQHEYVVRVGSYDGNSIPDLFVERTRGGSGLDGTLQHLILRGRSGGFTPVVPSSAVVQTARSWPRAAVRVALHDVNLDGFVDLLIGGLRRLSGLSGMPAQIILAPGRVTAAAPIAVRSVGGSLRDFGEDLREYLVEPDYIETNAPVSVVAVTHYDMSCQYSNYDMFWYGFADYCYPFVITTYVTVPDYSVFAESAVELWRTEARMEAGSLSRQAGYAQIEIIVEDALGAPVADRDLKELLGESADTIDPALERGMELFSALAGIGNAVAQEASGGTGINAPDAVLLTGRRVIGFGPFHTALQYGAATVSAYDSDPRALYDGRLISQVNWPPDHPSLTLQLGRANSALTPALYWQRLLAADRGYGDDLPYDAIPGIGAGGYNSNGFVAGIVAATGGATSVPMRGFVGGERPVPRGEFN